MGCGECSRLQYLEMVWAPDRMSESEVTRMIYKNRIDTVSERKIPCQWEDKVLEYMLEIEMIKYKNGMHRQLQTGGSPALVTPLRKFQETYVTVDKTRLL